MINIITALPCEARPLIEHYRLQGNARNRAFRCYQNDEICLIISGIGKLASAAATAHLATTENSCRGWLNIGIAGHPNRQIGEALLAHKIIDASSEQRWYPGMVLKVSVNSDSLTTVDVAKPDFPAGTMVDMEASGFFDAASRFQSCELIHVLKVISDNQAQSSHHITEASTSALIQDNLNTINDVIAEIQQLSHQLQQIEQLPEGFYPFIEKWHFTTFQQNELRHLLRRWHALLPTEPPLTTSFSDFNNSKAVMLAIKAHLDNQPYPLSRSLP